MRLLRRGGEYCRVADPRWADPLDRSYSRDRGGRWNPPHGFGVVYLNDSMQLARAQIRHKLGSRGIEPEDLLAEVAPVLVAVGVPEDDYVDVVTASGVREVGLPPTYPREGSGALVERSVCQPIGVQARREGRPGIACRPALERAPEGAEELAYFGRRRLKLLSRLRFEEWY